MKKSFALIMSLVIMVGLLSACAGETPGETVAPLDVAGTYSGTMTIGKTQIVYDSGPDGASEPYATEDAGEWENTVVDAKFQVEMIDETTMELTATEGEMTFQGEYSPSSNEFIYKYVDEELGSLENTVTLQFEETDGSISATGTIITVSDQPELSGLSNEVLIDLKKTE